MKSPFKLLFAIIFITFLGLCFVGGIQFRRWTQNLRDQQKLFLQTTLGPKTSPNRSPIVTNQEPPLQSPAETTAGESPYDLREFFERNQKKPLIETCSWLSPDKAPLFNTLLNKPKFFELMVMEQSLEIGLFAYRLPLVQALALKADEVPTLSNDVDFAWATFKAKKELEEYLPMARQVETQGYYARILAKILRQNPSLFGDHRLSTLCERFTNPDEPLSQEEMNHEVDLILQIAQVKPEEIDFDPHFKPSVEISRSHNGVPIYALKRK